MSYANFIPTVWNEAIQRELKKKLVFEKDCNTEFSGEIEQVGDQVRILNVGKPTITELDWSNLEDRKKFIGENGGIGNAEDVEGASVTMQINRIAKFRYRVNDIDKAQSKKGVEEALQSETSEGLANTIDKYIANVAKHKDAPKYNKDTMSINVNNVLKTLDKMLVKIYGNEVPDSAKIVMEVPFDFYMVVKEAYANVDTDNSELLENGIVGKYNKILFKTTNNVAKDDAGNYMILLRTSKAVAFANPLVHTEAGRVQDGFADEIKGFTLYDAKIVRPKEMLVLKCTVDMDTPKIIKTQAVTN